MQLQPIETSEMIERVAGWLTQKENLQWLHFGDGQKALTPAWLKMMTRSDKHALRVFTADDGTPIGVVALGDIDHTFRTATLWAVIGDKRYARSGYATRAISEMLRFGFRELALHAVNTWIVEHNHSVRIVNRLKFQHVGRQRQSHWIDGHPYDRLLFDILASEFAEVESQA